MRYLILFLMIFSLAASGQRTYYIATNGNDANAGTITAPFRSLQKGWSVISAGDTLYVRGGTYTISSQQVLNGKSGTASAKINLFAYPGEKPVISRVNGAFSKPYWHRGMVFLSGNYIHVKGIRFTNMYTDDNQVDAGLMCWDVNNCIFENLECDNNVEGMIIENNSNGNLVLNCDFHDNYSNYNGSNGGNSDGIGITYMTGRGTTTTVRGCRAWNNGDDGFDTFENQGMVIMENNWAWHNGYNKGTTTSAGDGVGFKLGSVFLAGNALQGTVLRKLTNNISTDNRNAGYHSNEGMLRCQLYNNVSYKNGNTGYHFQYGVLAHEFRNNVSLANGNWDVEISAASTSSNNSFGGKSDGGSGWQQTASAADFVSLDFSQLARPRKADGSLPDITAFNLASGSDLINTGINVGLPFNGTAPDRGAIEYGSQVIIVPPPPTVNAAPVANAGPDQTITLPTSTVTLQGSGTDTDGTIVSYVWSNAIGTTWSGQNQTMSGLIAGTYTYYLTVTDNKGATGTDTVKVTVNPAPRTVLLNIWVYSDKTVSTATRQNLNKTMVCRIAVYSDGTIEKLK